MGLRKIYECTDCGQTVKVYRDSEWQEYRVRSYPNGKLYAPADYHTTDKQDALDTALGILTKLLYA